MRVSLAPIAQLAEQFPFKEEVAGSIPAGRTSFMELSFLISAFFAGVLMFLAPCTLPFIPGYLAFLSGVSLKENAANTKVRFKIFLNGLFFVLGFSLIFISLGSLFGFLGKFLVYYKPWISSISGIFIILFGLSMTGILKFSYFQNIILFKPRIFKNSFLTSFIFGAAFSSGWTPCVGPILGTILILATTETSALKGGLLLIIFTLGFSIPFLILSFAFAKSFNFIRKFSKYLNAISVASGIFLIILGILLLTNNMATFVAWAYYLMRLTPLSNFEKFLLLSL